MCNTNNGIVLTNDVQSCRMCVGVLTNSFRCFNYSIMI